jgi:hypothetical protein
LSHEPPRTSARWLGVYDDPCDGNKSSLGGHFRSRDEPDDILVERSDGKKLKFVVDHKDEVPKDNFPTEAVYGNTTAPQLRQITSVASITKRTATRTTSSSTRTWRSHFRSVKATLRDLWSLNVAFTALVGERDDQHGGGNCCPLSK